MSLGEGFTRKGHRVSCTTLKEKDWLKPKKMQQVCILPPLTTDRLDVSQKNIQASYLEKQKEKSALPVRVGHM